MDDLFFRSDHEKATQALNFFALKANGIIYKLKAIKLVFLADRYHLRRYGRPVVGDQYEAMNHGPVGSLTKNLAEHNDRYLEPDEKNYLERYLEASPDKLLYKSIAPTDEEVFSETDIEALDFAWKNFGRLERFALADFTHAYPEWHRHMDTVELPPHRAAMSYLDFFDDPDPDEPLLAIVGPHDLFEMSDEDKNIAREWAEETSEIERLLR